MHGRGGYSARIAGRSILGMEHEMSKNNGNQTTGTKYGQAGHVLKDCKVLGGSDNRSVNREK